jgi:predicted enzyme related to lactoylglutathione lyase
VCPGRAEHRTPDGVQFQGLPGLGVPEHRGLGLRPGGEEGKLRPQGRWLVRPQLGLETPYFGATTGPEGEPGINGAIMGRQGDGSGPGAPVNGAVLTMGSTDFDATHDRVLAAGGQVALPKHALPGMAWQGYYLDTEGNVFGVHQPDPEAR